MKRYAGYRTEGGKYRGGLYKSARNEEHEYYECKLNTTSHCMSWTMKERSSGLAEDGACFCEEGDMPYCAHWECPHVNIEYDGDCDDSGCRDGVNRQTIACNCDETDNNERYCTKWSCEERTANRPVEYESYVCLKEDISGEYCFRWKGDVSSSNQLESAVCQCVNRTEMFCEYWECKERRLFRCAAHSGGWCDLNIAIGVGGGMGLLFTFLGCLCAQSTMTDKGTVICLLVAFLLGCLPWSLGVAVWGGVRAFPFVAPMWGFAWLLVVYSFAYKNRNRCTSSCQEARTVHPSPL